MVAQGQLPPCLTTSAIRSWLGLTSFVVQSSLSGSVITRSISCPLGIVHYYKGAQRIQDSSCWVGGWLWGSDTAMAVRRPDPLARRGGIQAEPGQFVCQRCTGTQRAAGDIEDHPGRHGPAKPRRPSLFHVLAQFLSLLIPVGFAVVVDPTEAV